MGVGGASILASITRIISCLRTLLIEQDRHSQHGNPNSRTHAHHAPGPPDACAVQTPRASPWH
jgi:hypothetical protein